MKNQLLMWGALIILLIFIASMAYSADTTPTKPPIEPPIKPPIDPPIEPPQGEKLTKETTQYLVEHGLLKYDLSEIKCSPTICVMTISKNEMKLTARLFLNEKIEMKDKQIIETLDSQVNGLLNKYATEQIALRNATKINSGNEIRIIRTKKTTTSGTVVATKENKCSIELFGWCIWP